MSQRTLPPAVLLAVALLCAATAGSRARAAEVIFPGIHPKLGAGAGQTVSRGSSALFYNPANLIFSKFVEPYLDVSFAMVTYTYQHTDTERFAPATIKVSAPPVTAGASVRPVPSFAVGVAILPLGLGTVQAVPNVPLQLLGQAYQLMNVQQKTTAYKLAAGAAFRLAFPLTIGAGIIRGSEKQEILGFRVDEESGEQTDEDPFLDAIYAGVYNQIVGGVRSELFDRKVVVALSYKTAAVKEYQGDFLVNLDPETSDYQPFDGKGYVPAVIGFGAETRFGPVGVFVDYTREMWSGGRTVAKKGFGSKAQEIDYIDTNNIVGGAKIWIAKKHMITIAGGMYGANLGDGTLPEEGAGLKQDDEEVIEVDGLKFGDLEAIQRIVASGGYRAKISGNGYLELGASYQTGSRTVPEGADGEGQYTLSVIMGSVGIAYGF